MDDDYADLLGSRSMPVRYEPASQLSFSKMAGFTVGGAFLGMALYFVAVLGWNSYRSIREKSYKLSMRRRHGIPDSDHRPFNVAYAAALRTRQGRERPTPRQSIVEPLPVQQPQTPNQFLKQRTVQVQRSVSESVPWPGSSRFPNQYNTLSSVATAGPSSQLIAPQPSSRVTFADGLDTSASPIPSAPPPRRKSTGIMQPASKHQLEDEGYTTDNSKKTRIEGDELIDGDEDPAWLDVSSRASRSSKRTNVDEDAGALSERAREKRPRNNSNDSTLSDDDMVIDYQEVEHRSPSTARGKKRERVDSGSMAGFDDSLEVEAAREKKRRNKRRSDASSTSSRGRKRERDVEDEIQEEADETSPQVARKKRGKRAQREQEDSSMEITPEKPRRREIGEEWESNGVHYKMGPNGERLRKTLVKKSTNVTMPADSIHPDREARLDVFVEQWLTEEGYKEMREQRRLPHQDTPPKTEPSTPTSEISESPFDAPRAGKRLLWEASSGSRMSNMGDPFSSSTPQPPMTPPIRRSVATAIGLQHTAFPRRITSNLATSVSAPGSPGLGDSTNSIGIGSPRPLKGYSKWEKQDLEAKAMSKIRDANQKKKDELDKLEQEKKDKLKALMPAPAAAAPTLPAISFSKPDEKTTPGSAATPASNNLFAPPKSSPLASAPPLGGDSAKPSSNPLFSKPPASTDTTKAPPASAPAASKPAIPSFFSSPSTAPATSTPTSEAAKPTGLDFFAAAKPKGPGGLGMGFPSSAPTPTPAAPVAAPAASAPKPPSTNAFNFGGGFGTTQSKAAPSPSPAPAPVVASQPAQAGGSLLNRLAPLGGAAAPTPSTAPAPASQSSFAFKPAQPAAQKPAPSTQPQGGAASNPTPPGSGEKAQFNFFTAPKPAEKKDNAPAPSTAAPAPATFNFGGGKTPAPSSASSPAPSAFGKPAAPAPAPSAFGNSSAPAPQSVFGGNTSAAAPAPPATASPFGAPAATATSAFGGQSAFGGFAGGKSAFGAPAPAAASTPAPEANADVFGSAPKEKEGGAEPAKPMFSFGSNAGGSVFGGGGSTSAAKDAGLKTSSFGTSGIFGAAEKEKKDEGAKSAEVKPASAFGFGGAAPSGGGSAFSFGGAAAAKEPQQASPFGAASTSSAPAPPATKSAFSFGNAPSSSAFGGAAKPAESTPAKSAFGFGAAAPSTFGTAKPADAPTFSFGAPAKPADGASVTKPGTFSFGTPFGNPS